jgi:HD-GYP domain-containing protein (c-di-GMP phosphodiesterase class II)
VERAHHKPEFKLHCEYGERNVAALKLFPDSQGLVLYHHERADGLGLYGKKAGETPIGAEFIAITDTVDVTYHLQQVAPERLNEIHSYIQKNKGTRFTARSADALLAVLDNKLLLSLDDKKIVDTAESIIPTWNVDINDSAMMHLADFILRIIDYKSKFTRKHTAQIAAKSWLMGEFYGFDASKRSRVYLAAALHDIGKLAIPSNILEKPGALTDEEFKIIKSHVYKTWELLKDIDGLAEICVWASNHHEKLDGSGYPFGKHDHDLDFPSRLIACLDIYQAVSEERPYHLGRSHLNTMAIMSEMADRGFIDASIVNDLDTAMAPYSGKDVPPPCLSSYKAGMSVQNSSKVIVEK